MEKLLNPYDKEFMRMAMLKHEETFKEQVLNYYLISLLDYFLNFKASFTLDIISSGT